MNKVEQIRAEVERLKNQYDKEADRTIRYNHPDIVYQGVKARYSLCKFLLEYIDSLQEESKKERLDDDVVSNEPIYNDKCDGCNNVKGCVTCKDGSEWAHYEEPVNDSLEEAAENYLDYIIKKTPSVEYDQWTLYVLKRAFKEGTAWQKQKDENLLQDHVAYKRGKEYGYNKCKKQMMKDAVEGLVICDELTHGYKDIVFAIPDVLKVGDKVKLIIIKEE